MLGSLRYLLLQVRKPGDTMAPHEVHGFAKHLRCPESNIQIHDLISGQPTRSQLDDVDAVLLGGSGDFSVVTGGPWLEPALETMRELHELSKPTFASCWGFQAFSLALGGSVVTDIQRAEVGSFDLRLTQIGLEDPVFSPMGETFCAQLGHQDIVERLPEGAHCLASSDRVANQAFCFPGKPIYGTQFHPELDLSTLLDRLRTYPAYIESITGLEYDQFVKRCCRESKATEGLLERFARHVFRHLDHA
ncbi:MAG: type 1 glutamine amidotransferase [Phycisphaerales bacterium]|nr:type 1 glutamine amidotransferase [Phycisphaerales bacterium]